MNVTRARGNSWQQLLSGLAMGLVALGTVFSALILSSQESSITQPTVVALMSPTEPSESTAAPGTSTPVTASTQVTQATSTEAAATRTPSATSIPTIACSIPLGWTLYTVRTGDTLASIASAKNVDVYLLIQGNCLVQTEVTPGQTLYLPPASTRNPEPTPVRTPCGPPPNWPIYRVQPGDTLYGLALRYRISVWALANANCLPSYILRAGQPLFVPFLIITQPTATRIPPSATVTASFTPISLPSPSPTVAPGVTPSRTPTALPPTITTSPSATPSASSAPGSPTPTLEVTASATPVPPTPSDTLPPPSASPTQVPPSATLPPPTASSTPAPPSAIPIPPTATSAPATATPVPPTAQAPASATPSGAATP